MAYTPLAIAQILAAEGATMKTKLKEAAAIITPKTKNLTREQRQRYGSINEQNKLRVNKAADYYDTNPELASPDVDWTVFKASLTSRKLLAEVESMAASLIEMVSDARILLDYDLMQLSGIDYQYTKYKAEQTGASGGYTTKYEEMKQFVTPDLPAEEPETEEGPTDAPDA